MDFFRILFNNEYSKKNGKYGIVDVSKTVNEYLLNDGEPFPFELFIDLEFIWEGSSKKSFCDFQMTYYPWRLLSEKMFLILKGYSKESDVYYHQVKVSSNEQGTRDYYLMHFLSKKDVLDKTRTGESMINPIVHKDRLNDTHLFVYKESDPSVFCMSEVVKNELEKNKITGCSFQKIS